MNNPKFSFSPDHYLKKRQVIFTCITLFGLIIPFITIGGNHFFLLNFEHTTIHLFFNSFSAQELKFMPFFIIAFFLFIFFVTTLAGRIWCGWSCPQTIFRFIYRDLIQTKLLKIRKTSANKQKPAKKGTKHIIGIVIWAILALIIASNFVWFFVPPEDFFEYIKSPADHPVMMGFLFVVAIFLFLDVAFLEERFCVYVCPYARVQSTLFDSDSVQVIYNEQRGGKIYSDSGEKIANKPSGKDDLCVGCNGCVAVCPTHIDIRKGMQLECINCLECADACAKVMKRFNEPSLIEWTSKNAMQANTSPKLFRFKTIGYIVIISLALILGFGLFASKDGMVVKITSDQKPYYIEKLPNGEIDITNNYVFMIENTDHKDHSYKFDIDDKNIVMVKPSNEVKVSANGKRRVIVELKLKENPTNNANSDVVVPFNIHAYSVDDKEIFTNLSSTFIYPSATKISQKANE